MLRHKKTRRGAGLVVGAMSAIYPYRAFDNANPSPRAKPFSKGVEADKPGYARITNVVGGLSGLDGLKQFLREQFRHGSSS